LEILIVNQSEVPQLLPMSECIEVMAEALKALARGSAILPLRPTLWLPEKTGALVVMPAYLGDSDLLGLKVITYFAGNRGTALDTHQGGVMVFDAHDGRLLSLIDATEITTIRTAAVSGVATRLFARPDAGDLAILGSGTQARSHLEAMLLVLQVRRVRVWSKHVENARLFARRESERHEITIEASSTAREAVEGADVICTTTSAKEPVLQGRWLSAGVHINAVGSSIPFTRELDTGAVARSRMFVDRRESALNEAGDFLIPKNEGAIDDSHILGEIGEVLLGQIPGRTSPEQITLFKSLGLAIEDLAAAHHILGKAREKGLGSRIELGGSRRETTT
jgi:ornithine cyclodeaminase/alanine dehydrogenase-like protein (mu-crystallin family)